MSEPWTIERICDALGNPALAKRALAEINKAPAHQLLQAFAKWERIAKNTVAAFEQGSEIIAHESRGEEPPGEWIDGTERIQGQAARIRARGAA
ncbi:hypothetical protein [Streptomyces sp. TS71-3]|uniref:hypothetical protein n=1 Tax=Streptomyces sp. TS71-3 TaxID=2733862 RepID=UPI001B0D8542|nr:hypothetical protein [Streptomyces sp. TS71-3]GHJ36479.1 hypothetical protein Sm713_20880 [Streptomyces sp. TS71-3]